MSLVVLLRGINVGGHRRLRPVSLAARLRHLDAVNIGATGTLVIRAPVGRRQLRDEISNSLPFPCEIVICDGRELSRLVARGLFTGRSIGPGVVPFVSVFVRTPSRTVRIPFQVPPQGRWLVKVLSRDGRFLVGLHRREMKAIGALVELDRVMGVRAATRSWNTMKRIDEVLRSPSSQ